MNLTEEQKFAIHWCFNYAIKYVDKYSPTQNPYGPTDVIVNGININETIKNLLGDRATPAANPAAKRFILLQT